MVCYAVALWELGGITKSSSTTLQRQGQGSPLWLLQGALHLEWMNMTPDCASVHAERETATSVQARSVPPYA